VSTQSKTRAAGKRINAGSFVTQREWLTISGQAISIPDSQHFIHLQFRRFAGCPVCSLHLRSFVQRHDEIGNAGVREVVLFHSSAKTLADHASDLPFPVIADPDKRVYHEFGVEASIRSLLDPRAWSAIVRGVLTSVREARAGRKPAPPINPEGGRFGLPADFLIAPDGRVVASKYGVRADDQWSVDELLILVPSQRTLAGHQAASFGRELQAINEGSN
jgi:peroxiredoxin